MAKRTYTIAGEIAARMRVARSEAGMTTRELARESQLDRSTVLRMEAGGIRNPGVGTLADLARALRVNVAWLAYGLGEDR